MDRHAAIVAVVILATALAPVVGCALGWLVTRASGSERLSGAPVDPWTGWYAFEDCDPDDRY